MTDDQKYFELLSYLRNELTPDEVARIEDDLKRDDELSATLLALAEDEARISEWARSSEEIVVAQQRPDCRPVNYWSRSLAVLMGLAACLLLMTIADQAGWTAFGPAPGELQVGSRQATPSGGGHNLPTEVTKAVARVDYQSAGCQWFIENRIWESDEFVYPSETLHLNKGHLDLTFVNQTKISLSAPAVLKIEGPMLTRLQRGSVNVEVGKGAEGFEVLTPLTRVVDLGTRFGLNVDNEGLTDVVVFEGAVNVEAGYDNNAAEPLMQRLDAGEGVRFDHQGTMSRVVNVAKDHFPSRRGNTPDSRVQQRPIVISAVWDNIERGDSFKFYEIVPAGLQEDAKAFVDRVYYEWNGVDQDGMPSYLLGSDYVKTFNSDKHNAGISISLRIEQPATLYLLIDNRVTIPDWVRASYEDTGDDIGIDEGFDRRAPHLSTDVGPGRSINSFCSVWRRVITEPGVVELGAIEALAPGPNQTHISMYGIAAAPLH